MKKTIHSSLVMSTVILGLSALVDSPVHAQKVVLLDPIARVGESAPSTPVAATWTSFADNAAHISTDGTVGFAADTTLGEEGIWFGTSGAFELGALNGEVAPGAGGATFGSFIDNLAASPGSAGIFQNRVSGNNDGIWIYPTGGPAPVLVALEDGPSPIGGANYSVISISVFNDVNESVWIGTLDTAPTRFICSNIGGGVAQLVARASGATGLPGALAGTTYSTFGTQELGINNVGEFVFVSNLNGGATTNADDLVLLQTTVPVPVGGPTVIAREGDLAPGSGAFPFSDFSAALNNDSGDVIFRSTLAGGAPVTANTGIWFSDGAVSLVALEGNVAPGTAGAYEFSGFEELFLANNGVIAFAAEVRLLGGGATVGRGVWIDLDGVGGAPMELVALETGVAPDKAGAALPTPLLRIDALTMSTDGDLAFEGRHGVSIGGSTKGIWVREAAVGEPTKLVVADGENTYSSVGVPFAITGLDLPDDGSFTASGGGPVGRSRVLRDDGIPMARISLDSSPAGLFYVEQGSLSFVVTSTNDDAPGTVGAQFESLRPAGTLNEGNLVATRAYLADGVGDAVSGVSVQGIWAEVPDAVTNEPVLTLVARQGDPAAGAGGSTYGILALNPVFNDDGELAFGGQLSGAGNGLWFGTPGALQLLARTGDDASFTFSPLDTGTLYDFVRSPIALGNGGRLVSSCTFQLNELAGVTSSNNSAILRFGSSARVIAREGDVMPSGAPGRFDNLLNADVHSNNDNTPKVVFSAKRKLDALAGITTANRWGIWYHNGSTLSNIALGGQPAAGVGGGVTYLKPDDVAFGQGTLAAFLTSLAGAVVPGLNSQALYISNAGGAPVLEVRTGQTQLSGLGPAGVDPAATFASIGRPDVSGVNHVAFLGGLSVGVGPVTAANDQGVWRNVGGTTELVLREGDAVPDEDGNPTGDLFESFDHPVVNTSGRVVVSALTSGGRALFGEASSGTFLRLLAAGDNVDISDGLGGTVAVTVADVSYVGAGGGSSTGPYKAFNDTGFVLAYATMTTGESSLILILVP